jgi:bifunctional non-homologous end joining protein LigD
MARSKSTHKVTITHPDRIWFPEKKYTKADIIRYYQKIAPKMLLYIKDRPITMLRYPDGIYGEHWFHKDAPDYFPKWIQQVVVPKEGGVVHHVLCNNVETLVYLANQGCLIPHVWLSKAKKLNYPDRMIFDLDPPSTAFGLVRKVAFELKEFLEALGLHPYCMLTGSKGLHVVVPLKPVVPFDDVRAFAQQVARYFATKYPKAVTIEMRKQKRGKRLFLDVARNSYAATGVAPYAIRAYPKASVACPIDWKELADPKLVSQRYTIKTVFKRLANKGDPWKGIDGKAKNLKGAIKKFKTISAGNS